MWQQTPLELARKNQLPQLPDLLQAPRQIQVREISENRVPIEPAIGQQFGLTGPPPLLRFEKSAESRSEASRALQVGVVFSGGQAPGGHNVIAGLHFCLRALNPKSELWGFLGGPSGIVAHQVRALDAQFIAHYLNQGGFDMIGSGRMKIETSEQFAKALEACSTLKLDGLVVIGGDDSNTNAAFLAKYFQDHNCSTQVVGVPKTIDGDLKGSFCEISFGHDTACKLYSELIGNIARDAQSAAKYYHFIRLMGRSASHITLECALQTQPTHAIIGEEVLAKNETLSQIVDALCQVVETRAQAGKLYGVFLIPEGLIEFIPEMRDLLGELNDLLSRTDRPVLQSLKTQLSPISATLIASLPDALVQQLLMDRDPHGNVQVSRIETEKLLIELVGKKLKERSFAKGFNAISHFFGYEARASLPTHFDSEYTYALGATAALLVDQNFSGYMATVSQLTKPTKNWQAGGIPLVSLMAQEQRAGELKSVIKKTLVDIEGVAMARLMDMRKESVKDDHFRFPGPIQFFGPAEVCQAHTLTLGLEHPVDN